MDRLVKWVRHPETWVISVQLLVLYVVSTVLFFLLYGANRKVVEPLKPSVNAGKFFACLFVFVIAAVSNFVGVTSLVLLARKLSTIPPIALVAVPLVLILEKHVRAMRASGDADFRAQALGAAGVLAGIGSAAYLMMRQNPFV
jgi:hypothetical protein